MKKIIPFIKKITLSDNFTLFIRFTLFIAIIIWFYEQNWMAVFVTFLTYILTYFYIIFEKYKIIIPKEFQLIIIFFIYFSLFLGEVHNFYEKYFLWDTLLHLFSGLALWFVWFLILYIFYKSWKFQAPKSIIALFAFSFAMMLWAVWEIFEFLVDEFTTANMQKAKDLEFIYWYFDTRLWVRDTMFDLMIDTVWAIIASWVWYIYLKKWESFKIFDKMVSKFEESNKKLFK